MLWTVVALPGLALWGTNLRSALLTIRAAKLTGFVNGRMQWARFGVLLTACFLFVELVFMGAGVIAMLRPFNPDSNGIYNYLFAGLFILASLVITYVGKEWRRVDTDLVSNARKRAGVGDRIEES